MSRLDVALLQLVDAQGVADAGQVLDNATGHELWLVRRSLVKLGRMGELRQVAPDVWALPDREMGEAQVAEAARSQVRGAKEEDDGKADADADEDEQ